MSTDTLDLPPIVAGALASQQLPTHALETINSLALSHFDGMLPDLRALAERYRSVAFDLTTPKGLDAAKKARQDLRENGRFAVQRAEKQIKDCANELKRVIAPKVEQLIAIVQPIEEHVDGQIKAHEERVAREKAERERIDAERRAKHTTNIATLAGFIDRAAGRSAEEIARGIAYVERVSTHPDAFEEYSEEATRTKARVLAALKAMHAKAQADEAEAKRQREENERLRAQLEATRAATPREEPKGLAGAARGPETAEETTQAGAANESAPTGATGNAGDDAKRDGGPASPGGSDVITMAAIERGAAIIDAAYDGPPLNLTEISKRLGGLVLTRSFIEGKLGITHSHTEKSAVLWPASSFEAIKAALIEHIGGCR